MEENFFRKKRIVLAFAILSLLGGFLFLDADMTGNIITSRQYPINLVSLIGLFLVGCSAVLFMYFAKKK